MHLGIFYSMFTFGYTASGRIWNPDMLVLSPRMGVEYLEAPGWLEGFDWVPSRGSGDLVRLGLRAGSSM